jgi:hypothetical protein
VVEDFPVVGWRAPRSARYDLEKVEVLRPSRFWDPDATSGYRVILLNATAAWCEECRIEYEQLSTRVEERALRGFVAMGLLFDGTDFEPAEPVDLQSWAKQFEPSFPFALDPEEYLGRFGNAAVAPRNVLVDASDMTVIAKLDGYSETLLWQMVDEALAARGAP